MPALDEVAVSCCANPEAELDDVLRIYSSLGYRRFEGFVDWVKSAFDYTRAPSFYREKAAPYGIGYFSVHLPRFTDEDPEGSREQAVQASRFAAALGMKVVYPRATSRDAFARAGKPFLDAIDGLWLTPALEIHKGFPVDSIATMKEVLNGIGDRRMKAVLEVGHLWHAGETWRQAWDALGEHIAVVHIKDIKDGKNAPIGAGEIDLRGMLSHLNAVGFSGDYVVELLLPDRENTPRHLAEAREFLRPYLE